MALNCPPAVVSLSCLPAKASLAGWAAMLCVRALHPVRGPRAMGRLGVGQVEQASLGDQVLELAGDVGPGLGRDG